MARKAQSCCQSHRAPSFPWGALKNPDTQTDFTSASNQEGTELCKGCGHPACVFGPQRPGRPPPGIILMLGKATQDLGAPDEEDPVRKHEADYAMDEQNHSTCHGP